MSGILEKWELTLKKKSTKKLYLASVKHFLTCAYGGEFKKSNLEYESLADRFLAEVKNGRVWFDDLIAYAISLNDSPPKTAIAYVHASKKFIEDKLDIELTKKQSKKLNDALPVGSRARTKDGELTREVLRRILAHCDVKGNALFLFLESSGIRIGEALELQFGDVDLSKDPVKVRVRGEITKKGDAYDTYISSEAKEALLEWLNVRDAYIETATARGKALAKSGAGRGVKPIGDKRIFPFSFPVANSMWSHAIKKIKMDSKDASTGRAQFHIHMLRKFFSTQMKTANLPDAVVQAMIGHSGYLPEYDRFSQKQKDDYYMVGEPFLLLNVSADEKIKINGKIDEQNIKIDSQQQQISDLYTKLTDSNSLMIGYMSKVSSLETMNEALKKDWLGIHEELKPIFAKWEEIKEILAERSWQKEQSLRESGDKQEREEKAQFKTDNSTFFKGKVASSSSSE